MLTDTHRRVLDFVRDYIGAYAKAPRLGEIAAGIGIRSRGTVHRYLQGLAEAGLIEIVPRVSRGIRLLGEAAPKAALRLPLLGRIAAGRPIEAVPDQNELDLGRWLGPNRYALQVRGDSMIEAGILDGDTVVVEACERARDGDIVVALIDGEEVTLKVFRHDDDATVTLAPANARLAPMVFAAARVRIQGRVIGQLRLYH